MLLSWHTQPIILVERTKFNRDCFQGTTQYCVLNITMSDSRSVNIQYDMLKEWSPNDFCDTLIIHLVPTLGQMYLLTNT